MKHLVILVDINNIHTYNYYYEIFVLLLSSKILVMLVLKRYIDFRIEKDLYYIILNDR